jgi:hypothetical protein
MALAITFDSTSVRGVPDATQSEEIVQGTIAFSGSYPAGGDALSFAGTNKIQSRSAPIRVEIYEQPTAGQTAVGALFAFLKGTTQANGLLQINTAYTTPFTTGAYGSAFATTTVKFRAWFSLGQ